MTMTASRFNGSTPARKTLCPVEFFAGSINSRHIVSFSVEPQSFENLRLCMFGLLDFMNREFPIQDCRILKGTSISGLNSGRV